MKDPVRWREGNSEADAEVRALLASDETEAPSHGERKRIWAGLVPQIQMLPVPPPVAPLAPVAASGTAALAGKIALGVVLATAVGAGVHVARSRTRAAQPAPLVRATAPLAPKIPKPAIPPTVEPVTAVDTRALERPVAERPSARRPKAPPAIPAPAKPVDLPTPPVVAPSPVVVSNELLQEGRRLSRARAALRAHDPEAALGLLQSGSVGTAGLAQEREALTIEALWLRPASRDEAERRARAFMTAYPDSPYRARIKALVLGNR